MTKYLKARTGKIVLQGLATQKAKSWLCCSGRTFT